jgi:tyrosinase
MKDPMWDSVVGFGGNGSPDHQQKIGKWDYDCVVDGPFKDLRPSYLKFDYASHCLTRQWNNGTNFPGDMFGPQRSPENIAKINAHTKYDEFHPKLETGPHGSIHASTGGDMSPATSPNGQFSVSLSALIPC